MEIAVRFDELGQDSIVRICFCIIVNLKTVAGSIAIAVLLFFGIMFALSSAYQLSRLAVSALLFIVAFAIAYFITRRPMQIVQKLEIPGQMKAVSLRCPNCSASVDVSNIKIKSGVPYATCTYCGHTFEITEEPKW